MIDQALEDLRHALAVLFTGETLHARFSWEVGGRAVSEIGGRLIEDFVLSGIDRAFRDLQPRHYSSVEIFVPHAGRAIEDFRVEWSGADSRHTLLVDVKGHNELRVGSRPNLASIRKCIELYSDPKRASEEIVIFFCRYRPNIAPGQRGSELIYKTLPSSFESSCVFLLRNLSAANLDPANIGSGGRLLLAREDKVAFQKRDRSEFVDLLTQLRKRTHDQRASERSGIKALDM